MQGCRAFNFHISLPVSFSKVCLFKHCNTTPSRLLGWIKGPYFFIVFLFLHGWPKASLIPVRTVLPFKAVIADTIQYVHGTKWQGFVFVKKIAKGVWELWGRKGGSRLNGEKHVQHPWTATGERMVPLETRWFRWVCAWNTDTRQQQPYPPGPSPLSFLHAATRCTFENKCRHNTGRCRQNVTPPVSIQSA